MGTLTDKRGELKTTKGRHDVKATRLTIKNLGIIADTVIEIDKPLIVFFGRPMQGKSTILNSLKWLLSGKFPADVMRHGQSDALVQFEATDDGKPVVIRRTLYVAKDGTTKARELTYTRNGVPVGNPANAVKALLNPFLLDQDYLRNMMPLERGRFLSDLFGVDTTAEDAAISAAADKAKTLRIKIDSYGTIDLTPVKIVDVNLLHAERQAIIEDCNAKRTAASVSRMNVLGLHREACAGVEVKNAAIRAKYVAECDSIRSANEAARKVNENRASVCAKMDEAKERRKVLNAELEQIELNLAKGESWLMDHKQQAEKILPANPAEHKRPAAPDTSEFDIIIQAQPNTSNVDARLQQAGAQNVRAEQYAANVARNKAKIDDNAALLALEADQRKLKAAKVAKLADVCADAKVPGLVFMEGGGFEYEGTDASMLSDSQVMRLSQALSGMYPEGFGLSLIDRGESLGKNVLLLVEDAKARNANILVTVVGDKPAEVPADVGVFTIEKGKVEQ